MILLDLTADDLHGSPLPQPGGAGDKEDRGAVLVVAGGAAVPGAPVLTGLAALRVGAGKLALAAPRAHAPALGVAVPEAMIVPVPVSADGEIRARAARALAPHLDVCGALVIGPGMMDAEAARRLGLELLERAPALAVVVDAASLPQISDATTFAKAAQGRVVLTPHAGEMASMLSRSKDEVVADPLGAARQASTQFCSVVIMKGATSFVVDPAGTAWRHDGGVAGLGTSGSGDVLAGAIAGLIARGARPVDAARWAVFLHGAAGQRLARKVGPLGFIASELLAALPRVMAETA